MKILSVENPAQTPGNNDDLSVDKEEQSTQDEAGNRQYFNRYIANSCKRNNIRRKPGK